MSLEYNKKNIILAKNLRKNATPEEKRLWYDFLSTYPIRFQRQKAIDNFIADFYCHKAKLIIELDGSQHFTEKGQKSDELRTDILKEYGLTVIRISNRQINTNFHRVCAYIDSVVKSILPSMNHES
jgi:very-short-patch-repair endonuclease